ncbi:MAG: hypothetical protein ACLFWM_09240 [Actinomycetota bacterium]
MGWGRRAVSKVVRLTRLARTGGVRRALREAGANLWSTQEAYGLSRDLAVPFQVSPARIEIGVRPLEERDLAELLDPAEGDSPLQLERQRRLLDSGIPRCWVAVDAEDRPCFMVWLIRPDQNARMRQVFGPEFPALEPDEVLLERGFTPRRHRGQRVGPQALSLITETAHPAYRWAWAFVAVDNVAALKLVDRAGFRPAALRRSKWRLLHHSTQFHPLTPEAQAEGIDLPPGHEA